MSTFELTAALVMLVVAALLIVWDRMAVKKPPQDKFGRALCNLRIDEDENSPEAKVWRAMNERV